MIAFRTLLLEKKQNSFTKVWTKSLTHQLTILSDLRKNSGFIYTLRQIFLRSWLNVLLIFVPLGIASNATGFQPIVIFALNALAIVPLTGLLTYATENLASRLGVGLGALLNITFGNLVELIIL
jgi:Ca2+:H+ antiporter